MAELTALIPLGGREVEMRKPADGALIVLARVARGLPDAKIENADELPLEVRERLIRNLGTIGKIVESMIVQEADKDWLDDTMISGEVTAEQVFMAIRDVGERFNTDGATQAKKSQGPVRRVNPRSGRR